MYIIYFDVTSIVRQSVILLFPFSNTRWIRLTNWNYLPVSSNYFRSLFPFSWHRFQTKRNRSTQERFSPEKDKEVERPKKRESKERVCCATGMSCGKTRRVMPSKTLEPTAQKKKMKHQFYVDKWSSLLQIVFLSSGKKKKLGHFFVFVTCFWRKKYRMTFVARSGNRASQITSL